MFRVTVIHSIFTTKIFQQQAVCMFCFGCLVKDRMKQEAEKLCADFRDMSFKSVDMGG